MNPIATALFLVGYGLALPIGSRLASVVAGRHRLAMWGHQLGVMIAAVGWLMRGRLLLAALHLGWLALAGAWFGFGHRLPSRRRSSSPTGPS